MFGFLLTSGCWPKRCQCDRRKYTPCPSGSRRSSVSLFGGRRGWAARRRLPLLRGSKPKLEERRQESRQTPGEPLIWDGGHTLEDNNPNLSDKWSHTSALFSKYENLNALIVFMEQTFPNNPLYRPPTLWLLAEMIGFMAGIWCF